MRERLQPFFEELTSVLEALQNPDAVNCMQTIIRTKIQDYRAMIADKQRELAATTAASASARPTVGILVEKHNDKKRHFNTHHAFYQRQKYSKKQCNKG